jgi:hypothetical protein
MDKAELADDDRRENKGIGIGGPHAAVEVVQCIGEGQPVIDQPADVIRSIGVDIDGNRQRLAVSRSRTTMETEGCSHFQSVYDMQVMRPCLREIFPGMRTRIGADVIRLPIRRRALAVMFLQRRTIIRGFVTEPGAARVDETAIGDEAVPEIMSDFVPKMPEESSVWFAHRNAAPLALDIICLDHSYRNNAVVMARHDMGFVASGGGSARKSKAGPRTGVVDFVSK